MKCVFLVFAAMLVAAWGVSADEFSDARAFGAKVRSTLRPDLMIADWLGERGDPAALSKAQTDAELILAGTFSSVGVATNFPDCNVDWGSNATVDGYKEWTWQLNRHGALAQLAHYYTLTNDSRAVTTWMKLVRGWIRQMPPPPDGTRYDATLAWRSVDTGLRAAAWMYCIHAFVNAPEVTDEFLVEFYRSVRDHGHRLRTDYSWGNWHLSEMKGLVMLSVASPFLSEAAEWQKFAIGKIGDEMSVQVHPDGFHYELTTHYHRISESEFRDVVLFLRKYGITPPERLFRGLEKMYDVYIKLMRPNRTLPSLNDGEEEDCKWRLFLGSQFYPERKDYRYFFDPPGNAGGEEPKFLSCAMPYSGAISFRNSWSTDAVWAYMDASPLGCHEHEDYLNVLLYAYGKDMIVDAGNYEYDTSAMRDYVLNTRAHNTVIFDGYMQHRSQEGGDISVPVDWKVPFSFATTPDVDWAGAVYTNAYGDVRDRYGYRKDRKLFVRHARKLIFYKNVKGLAPFFVVIDRMEAQDGDKPHDYEIMWHLADGTFKMDANAFSMDFGASVRLDAFTSDRSASYVDKIGQTNPMQGWKPVRMPGPHEHHPIHTPVLCGTFSGSRRVVTVLYPHRDAECPIREVCAGESNADEDVELTLEDGRIVSLEERELPANTHFSARPYYDYEKDDAQTYVVTVPSGETNEIAQTAVDLLNGNSVTNFVKRGEGVLVVKDVLGPYLGSVTIEDGIYRTNPQARPNTACGSLSGGPVTVVEGASLELLTSVANTYFSGKTIYFGGDGYRGQGALRINGKTSTDQQSVTWGQKLVMTADARIQNDMYYYAKCISTSSLDMNGHELTLANPGNLTRSWLVETWRKDQNPILNPGNIIVEDGGLNVSGYWDALWGNAYEVVIAKNAELVFNSTAAQPSRTLRLREGGRLNSTGFPSTGSAWNNNWNGPVICEDPAGNTVNSSHSSYQFYIDGKVSGSGFSIQKPCTFHIRGGRYATSKNAFTNGVVATDGVTVNFAYQYSLPKDCGPVVLTNATCGFTGCGDKEDARKNVLDVCNLIAHGNSTVKEGYGTWRESVTKTGAGTLAYESWMGAPLLDVQGGVVAMPSTQYAGPIADVPELPKFDSIALANGGQVDFRDHAYTVAGLSGSGSLINVTTLTVTDSFTVDAVRAAAGDCISVDGSVAFSDVTLTIEGLEQQYVGAQFAVLRAAGGIVGLKTGMRDSTGKWCCSLSEDKKTLYANCISDGMLILVQ